jgi:hypothetical protein
MTHALRRLSLLVAGLLAACASIPDVGVPYYLPRATLMLTLQQTLQCNGNTPPDLVSAYSVTPTVSYSRDSKREYWFAFKDLDGLWSDADLKLVRTEDGRLVSINGTQTGQGQTITSAAISAIAPFVGKLTAQKVVQPPGKKTVCDTIKDWAGAGKPVTLSYVATMTFEHGRAEGQPVFIAQSGSDVLLDSLTRAGGIPQPVITVGAAENIAAPCPGATACSGDSPASGPATPKHPGAALVVARMAHVKVDVSVVPNPGPASPVWSKAFPIPVDGEAVLPVGRGKAFGTQAFELVLADSGAITTLHYTKTTGLAAALGAAHTTLSGIQPPSAADQAAALNAQSDLIAAQQRLVRCKADPTNCT